ncbi:5560_t:CDS:1, partial [Racocetra persica]
DNIDPEAELKKIIKDSNILIAETLQELINDKSNSSNTKIQEIINILINHTQTHFNTQLLYVFEEKNSFLKFVLLSNTYHD